MSDVHPEFGNPMTAEQYAREWDQNASHFERLGYYSMPLERLGRPKTVLELGCGAGRSTLALAKSGHTVVAVEINEPAARQALEYLSANGVATELTHAFPARPPGAPDAPQVTIVVGDALAGDILQSGLVANLDAVLCWFIGAELGVIADFAGKPRDAVSSDDVRGYRLSMQRQCYALGRQVLRDGGIVQIADRMRLVSWRDKDFAREQLVDTQTSIAGPGYRISRASTFLSRVSGQFEGSAIQYLTELPDAQIRVVTSVVATLVGPRG